MPKRLLLCVAASSITFCQCLHAQAPVPSTPEMEHKIDSILAKLTLDDKLALLGGEKRFFTHAVPAAGVPQFKMSDASVGVRTFGPAPAYTASVALAATWDPELAQRVGVSLGQDARARGVHFLLAPGVNIYRAPLNGRNFEYLGEDPYLTSRIAVPYIRGVQSQGVAATVKHFAANNSEYDRHRINAIIDERTLRELYLPAFEAAVKEGHVAAVMDSYNRVNGEHSTQNGHLNLDILKHDWGFTGLLMSDWDATYDGVAAANNGLDLEMPSAKLMTPETLKAALRAGTLKQATIDDKVHRLLRVAMEFGWMDRDQTDTAVALNHPEADALALDEARESLTLLKNDGGLLPLHADHMKTLVVMGPDAVQAIAGGGGSSRTTPFRADGVVAALTGYLRGRVKVVYVAGPQPLNELFRATSLRNLKLTSRNGEGSTVNEEKAGDTISSWDGSNRGAPRTEGAGDNTHTWLGEYVPVASGTYKLLVGASADDRLTLWLDGKQVVARGRGEGDSTSALEMPLSAGKPLQVKLEVVSHNASPQAGLALVNMAELLPATAQKQVREADAVLFAAGFDEKTESEGFDRTYRLPGLQAETIEAVSALNKRTIVTVTSGSAVETASWIANVPAVLDTYYGGQEGTRALSEVLFGERSPEGRLPWSWERTLAENATIAHYREENPERDSHYAEGLMVGYRYYTTERKHPLFPFGFGLTYTRFGISNLRATPQSADDVEVSFDVKNTGAREGATVAQVYVGDPSAKVKRPAMELKQFEKVRLAAGAQKHVVLHLNRRAFEYYDVAAKDWRLDPGHFTIFVGQSSAETPLKADITLH